MDNTEFFGNHMKVKLARPNKGEAATVKNTGSVQISIGFIMQGYISCNIL